MIPDYYQILGISADADFETIKQAYRTKALKCHPDRGGSHAAMLEINEAFEILRNPEMRASYDELRRNQSNKTALARVKADTERAKAHANDYPREWNLFEAWLNALTEDFLNAEYGSEGMLPTVGDSMSGFFFLIVGGVAGAFLGYLIFRVYLEIDSGPQVGYCAIGGAFVGQWFHRLIRNSIRAGDVGCKRRFNSSLPSDSNSNQGSTMQGEQEIIRCPHCSQRLRLKVAGTETRIRCRACGHEFVRGGAKSG